MTNSNIISMFLQTGEKSGQVEKSKKNARQRQNDFKVSDFMIPSPYKSKKMNPDESVFVSTLCVLQKMIEEVTNRLVKLIRGALLPTTLPQGELNLYGGWENKTELTGAWLTQIIHTVRSSLSLF